VGWDLRTGAQTGPRTGTILVLRSRDRIPGIPCLVIRLTNPLRPTSFWCHSRHRRGRRVLLTRDNDIPRSSSRHRSRLFVYSVHPVERRNPFPRACLAISLRSFHRLQRNTIVYALIFMQSAPSLSCLLHRAGLFPFTISSSPLACCSALYANANVNESSMDSARSCRR